MTVYVNVSRLTAAAALMTVLETSINTIDDDTELILSDKNAAVIASTSAKGSEKQSHFGLFLGGA